MEGGGRHEHEGASDQRPERGRKEEEGEKKDKRERESNEAPCAGYAGSYSLAPSTSISVSNVKEDRCIVLDNLFDGAVERDDIFYLRVRNHIHRNSAECGPVHHMHVDKKCGRVYMLFDSWRSANKAADKWHQSSYQGNVITVSFSLKYVARVKDMLETYFKSQDFPEYKYILKEGKLVSRQEQWTSIDCLATGSHD